MIGKILAIMLGTLLGVSSVVIGAVWAVWLVNQQNAVAQDHFWDWYRDHNQRGFIGCRAGQFVIENFDVGDLGSLKGPVFNLPEGNPCQ